ncbi:MAG: N-acetyltransferase [Culturomica sp.]|jgi:predicted GNAT family acetyltransferase|nr:N-acetyltransferase [Culturomica sp.]
MEKYVLKDNAERKRYEFDTDGLVKPHIDYIKNNQAVIYLTHTEVPQPLQGRGVGQALVKGVLEDVEKQGLRVVPTCPFVAAYMKRNPATQRLLMPGVNVG